MGFGYIKDNGPEDINTRYFKDRKDGLQVGSLSHIMKAQVWDRPGRTKGRFIKPTKNKIPQLRNEDEERDFWKSHDSTKYVDWKKAERLTFANLKPSVKTISLRLPESMLEEPKLLANKRDVPYQSMVKIFLSNQIEQELTDIAGRNMASHRIARKSGSR